MNKVETFTGTDIGVLRDKINAYLADNKAAKLVDIKFNTVVVSSYSLMNYSAMVIIELP